MSSGKMKMFYFLKPYAILTHMANNRPAVRTAYLGLKLEPELKIAIIAMAKERGIDTSAIIRLALRQFLNRLAAANRVRR